MTTKTTLPNPWPGLRQRSAGRPIAEDISAVQAMLTSARERLLDAFGKTSDPAPLLRLIEDLALVQERLSTIME